MGYEDLTQDDFNDYEQERESDYYERCGCRYCHCMTETEYGATCGDCQTGAHQG